jgi:hypothetical protein
LDPSLTPPVDIVSAQVDARVGRVRLEWTPYAGEQPFAHYLILRREQNLVKTDTLAQIADANTIAFEDTTIAPQVGYVYRVVVFNQHGFFQEGPERSIDAFSVGTPSLLAPQIDNAQGIIALRWNAYVGPDFERYEIRRRSFGGEQLLGTKTAVADTTWTDTDPEPRTEYFYWITTIAAGLELDSQRQETAYDLPPIELLQAELSHHSATATLSWTRYQGPGFVGYQVQQRAGRLSEETVTLLEDIDAISYVDALLDGNTNYEYRIIVRSRWQGIQVESNTLGGSFYRLLENQPLAPRANSAAHALALALDQEDRRYVGSTIILTTTANTIEAGLWVEFPDGDFRRYFQSHVPHALSAIHLAVDAGIVYATVRTEGGRLLVGAINEAKRQQWLFAEELGDVFPVGIFVDADGKATVSDAQGQLYRFDNSGQLEEIDDGLAVSTAQAIPLEYLFWSRDVLGNEDDQLFIVAPNRPINHLIGRIWSPPFFGGRSIVFDDGVGLGNGETLNPLVVGFDRRHNRVVVLEESGRLQVLHADQNIAPHYLTKWGTFGEGPGEFAPSPKTGSVPFNYVI